MHLIYTGIYNVYLITKLLCGIVKISWWQPQIKQIAYSRYKCNKALNAASLKTQRKALKLQLCR